MKEKKDAFLSLYDQEADALFRFIALRAKDREEAADLVQDAFMKTWEYLGTGKTISNLRAFLFRVARNLLIDRYRKKVPVSLDAILEEGEIADEASEREIEVRAEYSLVLGEMEQLSEGDREALFMRYVDDLPLSDIAGILEVSENALSVRIHRALGKLRTRVGV